MSGQDYTTKSVSFPYRKNSGGLNSTASPTTVEDNESSDCQNVDFDKYGAIKKRGGSVQLNTSAVNSGAAWTGLFWFEKSDGNNYLVGVCGDKIYEATSLTQAASPFTDRTNSLTITAGNNNHISWATHLDTVLGTNGVNPPFTMTGGAGASAMTVPTNLTAAKYVAVFSNYTFLANVVVSGTSHKSRLYWSAIDSITSWSSSDFRDVSKNDGQQITGIKALGESLVIFKDRSIWLAIFTGDSDIPFIFRRTRSNVGCIAGHSIQEVDNGLVFLAADGFYYFDGNNSYKLSDRITTTLNTFALSRFTNCVSVYYPSKNRYYSSFTLSGNSTHDRNITWDSFNNAFSLYKGLAANCFVRVITSGEERIYMGDYSGYVYRLDTTSNDNPAGVSTAIAAYYYTKWFDFGDLVAKKAVPELAIYHQFDNSTLTFAYSYNFENVDQYTQSVSLSAGGSLYGTGVWDSSAYSGVGGGIKKRHLTGRGETVRFGFKNSTASETFTIDGFGAFAHAETNL